MATVPYLKNGQYWMDVDPDDHNAVVYDVAKDLSDRATTATGVVAVIVGVTILQGPTQQGASLMTALTTIDQAANAPTPSITFRVTCADGQRFDRTINFNLVQN